MGDSNLKLRLSTRAAWLLCIGLLAPVKANAVETLPISKIRPGMKGYGLTVFRGSKPERFPIEVIDILHNFRPDQDLILIRTPHPILERASSVAGMSGSPIYIQDKLVGAYAYGWPFSKDPVAGVTPIASMLKELKRDRTRASRRSLKRTSRTPVTVGSAPNAATNALEQQAAKFAATVSLDSSLQPVPVSTPLLLSGFTDATTSVLREKLAPFAIEPVQAGAAGHMQRLHESHASFQGGSAIGVQLIRGDINATAVGTVTYVAKDRLIAFGHPMLNAGETGFPTATARVLHVMASTGKSFKIAEAVSPSGVLTQDRQSCIVVDRQAKANVVPVSLRLHGVPAAPRKLWRMEVVNHQVFTPFLVFAALHNAIDAAASDMSDVVFNTKARVQVSGHGTWTVSDGGFASAAGKSQMLSGLKVFQMLQAIYGNAFETAQVARVDLDLSLRFAREVIEIVDVSVDSNEVDPDEVINLYVRLRPFGGEEVTRIHKVRVPRAAAGASIQIDISPGNRVQPPRPQPDSLAELLNTINEGFSANSLVISTQLPSRGLQFRGHVVENLPLSVLTALQARSDSAKKNTFSSRNFKEVKMRRPLYGSARVKLQVRETPRRVSRSG